MVRRDLIRREFLTDVLSCECRGARKVFVVVFHRESKERVLERAPSRAMAWVCLSRNCGPTCLSLDVVCYAGNALDRSHKSVKFTKPTKSIKPIKSMPIRHRIHFPPQNAEDLAQDEVFFYVLEEGEKRRLRFHDYAGIYERPGLYEQLFYDRLKCTSPTRVADILRKTVEAQGQDATALRVLDLGAGNGMMGEALKRQGVSRLVGVDIIPEARDACSRDRPGMYDDYFVADFTDLDSQLREEIREWQVDCLTSVAALGFGDIPEAAFIQALEFVLPGGWAAFNIKHTFLDPSDSTGFSTLVRELLFSDCIEVHHIERYRHRLSMEGHPLSYFALVVRKKADLPAEMLRRVGVVR
ncbi:MAG: SAM-dependent methyltransferase [Planctomycetota bacterium]|jgi:SAM-dependent methyltransferase